jgi:hypothetical protein
LVSRSFLVLYAVEHPLALVDPILRYRLPALALAIDAVINLK